MTSAEPTRELFFIGNGRVTHTLRSDADLTMCGRPAENRYSAGAGEPGCERCYRRSAGAS